VAISPATPPLRLGAQCAFVQQFGHGCRFPLRFLAKRLKGNALAGQRPFDENDFALAAVFVLQMADATRFHVQGHDVDDVLLHDNLGARQRRAWVKVE